MSSIFISYRREDSAGHARALRDALARRFGPEEIFLDVDNLPPGADFPTAIRDEVKECKVLLALIGKSWLTARNADGVRRIDDAEDFVRIEIGTALTRGVPVIPITLQDVGVPRAESLPKTLKALARRQAFDLRHDRWETDVSLLIEQVDAIIDSRPASTAAADILRTASAKSSIGWKFSTGIFIATVLVALGGYVLASSATLPFQYSTLPTLAAVAILGGAVHGYERHTSPWLDLIVGASMTVVVVLAIFAVNYVPGEVSYWPQSDPSWTIAKEFGACLFCGFVLGALAARLIRGRWLS
jgi:hypothetical protein